MVVLLVAISAAIIVPNISFSNKPDSVRQEAERFAALVTVARQEAILKFKNYVLDVYKDHYEFRIIEPTGPKAIDSNVFRPREVPDFMYFKGSSDVEPIPLESSEEGDTAKEKPLPEMRVMILASGELTPFEVRLLGDDGSEYKVTGEISGELEVENARDNI